MSESPTDRPIPPEPLAVLQKFIDAGARNDVDTMKSCLSQSTLDSGNFNGEQAPGVTFSLGTPAWEGDTLIIPLHGTPQDPQAAAGATALEMPCIMFQENGAWKFDLNATMDRLMGPMMQQMTDTLSTAMEGVGNALKEGFDAAFGPSSDSSDELPDWSSASDDPAETELLPMPALTPLPKLQAALSASLGGGLREIHADAAIDDLLKQLGSDQRDGLIQWLDETLFAEFPNLLKSAAEKLPADFLLNRLHGLRIEAANHAQNRFLALDGSDLVYRLWLNSTDGYYSDTELAAILPGILAGLPETIAHTGHRLLATDDEYADLAVYKDAVIPRLMKRLSDAVGKPVALKHEFDNLHDPATIARLLQRWGVNRALGAVLLATFDDSLAPIVKGNLKTVHYIDDVMANRYARFTPDGTLQINLRLFQEENGCFYEADIFRALAGEPLGFNEPSSEEPANQEAMSTGPHHSYGCPEPDDDEEEDEAREDEPDAPALTNDEQNREHFRTAVAQYRDLNDTWKMQLDLSFGHPTQLTLDWDSLNEDYQSLANFMASALSGGLQGIGMAAFDPQFKPAFASINHVTITRTPTTVPTSATLNGDELTLRVNIDSADGPPPVMEIADLVKLAVSDSAPAEDHSYDLAPPLPPAPKRGDRSNPHVRTKLLAAQLEVELHDSGLWPGDKPDGPLEVKGAFGCENMSFEQWLAWVLLPRLHDIVQTKGDFPKNSGLAAYARRGFDGIPPKQSAPVIEALQNIDDFVNALPTS